MNTIDQVFKVEVTSTPVKPQESAEVTIVFKPNVVGLSYTEYYIVDDTYGNSYRITVTGKCFGTFINLYCQALLRRCFNLLIDYIAGPKVTLSKKKIAFTICKNVSEQRKDTINIVNKTDVDTTYQWLLPYGGQGFFQVSIFY